MKVSHAILIVWHLPRGQCPTHSRIVVSCLSVSVTTILGRTSIWPEGRLPKLTKHSLLIATATTALLQSSYGSRFALPTLEH